MVDNRGISPISTMGFKSDNASANKMSDEKYGQGGEYFVQEMEEEQASQQSYQDRSAQLRASLNGLAAVNAGSMMFLKAIKEKEEEKEKKKPKATNMYEDDEEEVLKD